LQASGYLYNSYKLIVFKPPPKLKTPKGGIRDDWLYDQRLDLFITYLRPERRNGCVRIFTYGRKIDNAFHVIHNISYFPKGCEDRITLYWLYEYNIMHYPCGVDSDSYRLIDIRNGRLKSLRHIGDHICPQKDIEHFIRVPDLIYKNKAASICKVKLHSGKILFSGSIFNIKLNASDERELILWQKGTFRLFSMTTEYRFTSDEDLFLFERDGKKLVIHRYRYSSNNTIIRTFVARTWIPGNGVYYQWLQKEQTLVFFRTKSSKYVTITGVILPFIHKNTFFSRSMFIQTIKYELHQPIIMRPSNVKYVNIGKRGDILQFVVTSTIVNGTKIDMFTYAKSYAVQN
jgi:hypothetical protein